MTFGVKIMNFEEIDILTLLPQRPPFVMVDRLVHYDSVKCVTRLEIKEDNIFVEDGKFTSSGLIENIAQTCAARMGYINQFLNNDTVKLGFIGAIKNLNIAKLPGVGQTIETSIEIVEEVFQMTLVNAAITLDGEVIVTSEMKIALTDIDSKVE